MDGRKDVLITSGTYNGKHISAAVFYDGSGKPDSVDIYSDGQKSAVGEIIAARVQSISKQINAAFLDLGDGRRAFLPLSPRMKFAYTNKHSSGEELHQGDEIAVQIVRDPIKTKEAQASNVLAFYGQYCLVEINGRRISVSKKIPKEKKERLKEIACRVYTESMIDDNSSYSIGVLVRTAAQNASEDELEEDLSLLFSRVLEFQENLIYKKLFESLQKPIDPCIEKIARILPEELGEIVTDDPAFLRSLKESCVNMPRLEAHVSKLRMYEDASYPLWKLRGMDQLLKELSGKNVWLKSGAYLVIESTEALHVVDVNSGKFNTKKASPEKMLLINKEAAKEIAQQIRLRNLSGMILVDFINMKNEEDWTELMSYMRKAVKKDFAPVTVVDYTKLGLMEMTRKKTGPSLKEKLLDSI